MRVADPKACQCGEVLKGVLKPWECKVFGTACTPETPIGTCMVSSEGACAAYYNFGQYAKQRLSPRGAPVTTNFSEDQVGERIEAMRRRPQRFRDERVTMAHGAGGKASRALVEGLVVPLLANPALEQLSDAGLLTVGTSRLALTTDAFVVRPIRFPGGSIGELAVNGTVNDLAVSGARPVGLSAALVLEEGLSADVLEAEITAMAGAARAADVPVVTGDTKVVERGKCDSMYVVTTGVGLIDEGVLLAPQLVRPGDKVLISGTVGDHGVAILLARGDLDIEADVRSDTQPLWSLASALIGACGDGLHCMRDATRGGVATVLNEIAMAAEVGIVLEESRVPVRPEVVGAGEILGIDPLYVANEGKLVAFVAPELADAALDAMRALPAGVDAAIVGEVREEPPGRVLGRTDVRGTSADRHAGRGPAAAHLLSGADRQTACSGAEVAEQVIDHEGRPQDRLPDGQDVVPDPVGLLPVVDSSSDESQPVDRASAAPAGSRGLRPA